MRHVLVFLRPDEWGFWWHDGSLGLGVVAVVRFDGVVAS